MGGSCFWLQRCNRLELFATTTAPIPKVPTEKRSSSETTAAELAKLKGTLTFHPALLEVMA